MIIIVLATLGFTSTIGQVVLMRELVAVFYGNELVFGLILAWWLLWEAAGAWGLGRWAERRGWGRRALALALALAALALPLQIVLTRCVRDLMGVTPGAFVPLGSMVWAVGLITALYPLAHGLCFSLGARLLAELRAGCARGAQKAVDAEGAAGRAYTFESVGAVVGGALFSFLLVGWLDPVQVVLGVGAVALVVVVGYWILDIGDSVSWPSWVGLWWR